MLVITTDKDVSDSLGELVALQLQGFRTTQGEDAEGNIIYISVK